MLALLVASLLVGRFSLTSLWWPLQGVRTFRSTNDIASFYSLHSVSLAGVIDWEREKKVWSDQMKDWKIRGYEWSEEKRALDSECLKLKADMKSLEKEKTEEVEALKAKTVGE